MNETNFNNIDNDELGKNFLINNIRNTEPRHILKNPIYQRMHEIILESGNCIEHFSLTYPLNQITYTMKPNTEIVINGVVFGTNYFIEDLEFENITISLNDGGITAQTKNSSFYSPTDHIEVFEVHIGKSPYKENKTKEEVNK